MKNIKQTITIIHQLLNDSSNDSKGNRYGLYAFFLLDAVATLLNLGVLYGIFYLYLQNRINLGLCLAALFASVLFKLVVAYLKIHRQAVIIEQLNTAVAEKAFTHVLTKKDEDYSQSEFRVEQLSARVARCLMSYFDLFGNLSLFLIVFVLMLFKATLLVTLVGYVVLAAVLFGWLNRNKEKTENLIDEYRWKKKRFIGDVAQLKDTLTGIGQIDAIPIAFAKVNKKHYRLRRGLREIVLRKNAMMEVFTICYLITCFLLWTLLYDKEQVLSLLAIMVLLTAQLFPKAIRVLGNYHEIRDNFAFVEQYFTLKQQVAEKSYQGRGALHYDEQCFVISELSLQYAERQLFDNASLKLPARGHFILKASNGAGKSTLLKWIVAQMAETPYKAYYIPQQLHIYHGTILANIKLFADAYNEEKVHNALQISGFAEVMTRKNYTLSSIVRHRELSGGERAKLILTSLLYHHDEIAVLLVDEIAANLDAESTRHFYRVVAEMMADKLVIEITHETSYGDNPQHIEIIKGKLLLH